MENHPKYPGLPKFESQVIQGVEAVRILEEESFKVKWANLLEDSIAKSVFQAESFVLPWYKVNQADHIPIIVTAYSGDKLVGLLTLAQKFDKESGKKSDRLEGAGSFYALYQNWIVLPEFLEIFWEVGVLGLFRIFPNAYVNLKSVSGENIFMAIENLPSFKKMTVIETYQNPILDYQRDGFEEILNKRHFRSKSNRINRAGEVKFEKVKSKEELIFSFNDVSVFHDLRQGAAFNKIPFGKDIAPRQLFLEWFEKGILHVSLLWFNKEIIAAVVIIIDNETAHLAGLITYSPRHGKLSPGLVHLYYLGLLLHEEGFKNLKLSPGYDSYKERFCNSHEDVHELLISPNLSDILKRKVRKKMRQNYFKFGVRPMDVEVILNKKKAQYINRLNNISKGFILKNSNKDVLIMNWAKKIVGNDTLPNLNYRKDNLGDLLLVGDYDLLVSRWEFLVDSLKRLEDNQNFITLVENDKLLACIWYKDQFLIAPDKNIITPGFENFKVYVSLDFKLNKN